MPRKQEADTEAVNISRTQASQAPRDRFDAVTRRGRVGSHRIVGEPRRFWVYLISALVGIAVLTGVGIVAVQMTGANMNDWLSEVEDEGPVAQEPTVDPVIDPDAEVAVINGTSMPGFGAIVDAIITENGWGQILFSGDGAANDIEISAVFYGSVADESAALGLANELGGVSIYQSYDYLQEYGARLVVLLGSDYGGPGSDQLVLAEPDAESAPVEEATE